MKLNYSFELVDMGDEQIAVPVGNNASSLDGVLKLNQEGAEVFSLLQQNYTIDSIVETLSKKYDNNREELILYVNNFISALMTKGIISD